MVDAMEDEGRACTNMPNAGCCPKEISIAFINRMNGDYANQHWWSPTSVEHPKTIGLGFTSTDAPTGFTLGP